MNIQIDGKEYQVSMTWHDDNTLQHFVLIDDKWVDLEFDSVAVLGDDHTEKDHAAEREFFTKKVRDVLQKSDTRYK